MSKEIFDLKRNLNDETREKEAVQRTAAELRNKVKGTEAEKVDLSRNVNDLKQRVGSKCQEFQLLKYGKMNQQQVVLTICIFKSESLHSTNDPKCRPVNL